MKSSEARSRKKPPKKTKISKYKVKEEKISDKIEDRKKTLELNQKLLYDLILSTKSEKAKTLVDKCKALWENTNSIIEKKYNIEIETNNIKKKIDETSIKIQKEINDINFKNNKNKKEIVSREEKIKKLKADLEKTRKSAFFKTARTEVQVSGPSRLSIDMNQEVIQAKKIISKALNKHSKEKKKSEKLGRDVKNLKEKMNNLKKTAKNYNDKLNNDDDFVNYVGGYLNIENNEKDFEEEEEKEESKESSDDGKYKGGNEGNSKAKLEEYEKLKTV